MNNIPCQEYAIKFPTQFINGFTYVEHSVLKIILESIARYGNGIIINQTVMASKIGCAVRSVGRAVRKFKDIGLLLVKQQFNKPAYMSLTNYFSFPLVRQALMRIFKTFPMFMINVSMLLSGNVLFKERVTNPDRTGYLEVISIEVPSTKVGKKGPRVGVEVDQFAVRKILSIEEALIKRGERREEMDIEKLAGFPVECLDSSIARMRTAKVKEPFNFFMHLCWKWSKENNREPNFVVADYLRDNGILAKYRALSKPDRPGYAYKAKETERVIDTQESKNIESRQNAKSVENLKAYQSRHPVKLVDKSTVNMQSGLMQQVFKLGQVKLDAMEDQWSPEAMVIRKEFESWGFPYVLRIVEETK
jgi:hypothetical protein